MCVKFLPRDLNPGFYPSHPTSTYTFEVTIVLKICSAIPSSHSKILYIVPPHLRISLSNLLGTSYTLKSLGLFDKKNNI